MQQLARVYELSFPCNFSAAYRDELFGKADPTGELDAIFRNGLYLAEAIKPFKPSSVFPSPLPGVEALL